MVIVCECLITWRSLNVGALVVTASDFFTSIESPLLARYFTHINLTVVRRDSGAPNSIRSSTQPLSRKVKASGVVKEVMCVSRRGALFDLPLLDLDFFYRGQRSVHWGEPPRDFVIYTLVLWGAEAPPDAKRPRVS
jgi:hypothetical protein